MSGSEKMVTAEEIDRAFDAGEDMRKYFDFSKAKVVYPDGKPAICHVNVGFPVEMIRELDSEATRLAIPRQAVIKTLIDEALTARKRARREAGAL